LKLRAYVKKWLCIHLIKKHYAPVPYTHTKCKVFYLVLLAPQKIIYFLKIELYKNLISLLLMYLPASDTHHVYRVGWNCWYFEVKLFCLFYFISYDFLKISIFLKWSYETWSYSVACPPCNCVLYSELSAFDCSHLQYLFALLKPFSSTDLWIVWIGNKCVKHVVVAMQSEVLYWFYETPSFLNGYLLS